MTLTQDIDTMRTFLIIVVAFSLVAFVTNPQHADFQAKANELWEQGLNQEADSGKIVAKIARFLGAGKSGGLVLSVQREDFFLFSLGTVYNNIDGQPLGTMLGCFGQVYLIDGISDTQY